MNILIQRFLQRIHHLQHALLAVRPEGSLDVSLPQRLPQRSVHQIDAAFPAILNLLLPGQRLSHLEIRIHKWLRQPRSSTSQHMPTHIRLQRIQRQRRNHSVDLPEEIRIGDIHRGEVRRTDSRKIAIERKLRRHRHHFLARHLVIAVLRIAHLGAVHRVRRQQGFDHQHSLRRTRRLLRRLARQREHLRHILRQMLPHLDFVGVVLDVVVAIRQRQPSLPDVSDHLIRIVQIRRRIKIEQRIRPDQMNAGDLLNQRALVLHRRNPIQFRLERRDPFRVRCLLVHA